MTQPYSVVVPAYNAADTLAEALRSILHQSLTPAQVIVVDDGSTDNTAAIAREFGDPVVVIRQENRGCGAATNAGIEQVTAPWLAFLDADDVWLPGKAECQMQHFATHHGIAALCGRAQVFKGSAESPELGTIHDLWGRTTMMIRTDAARRIGPVIDPPGGRGDIVDWIARGRELGLRFEMMSDVLARRRIRPGSLSYGRDAEKDRGYLLTVKRALDRKRAKAAVVDGEDDAI